MFRLAHAVSFPWVLVGTLAAGCQGAGLVHYDQRDPCTSVYGIGDNDDQYVITRVLTEEDPEGIAIQVFYPRAEPALVDGAPVVVVLPGGFDAEVVPVEGGERVFLAGRGIVQLYLNFPGGDGTWSTPGDNDYRGPASRRAAATALRYASGEIPDEDGCFIEDRVSVALAPLPPILHGQSNGGNLAFATLADQSLALPEIAGVTTFETPASSQFVTVEVGSSSQSLSAYEKYSCTWEEGTGLVCRVDYSDLAWSSTVTREEGEIPGALYFDLDGDGNCTTSEDYVVWGLRPVIEGENRIVYSPTLTEYVEQDLGLPESLLASGDSSSFWGKRDASRQVTQAVARHPDLKVIAVGTARDHMLGIPDHAHITGLASALVEAGIQWVRVNPDRVYVETLTDADADFADNPVDMDVFPGDDRYDMEPDEGDTGVGHRFYNTAAALEIAERSLLDRWEPDLDSPLDP